jgi:hypothetical protein
MFFPVITLPPYKTIYSKSIRNTFITELQVLLIEILSSWQEKILIPFAL